MNNIDLNDKTDENVAAVIDLIPLFVLWLDDQFKIKNTNDLFLSFLNKTKNEVLGTNLFDYAFKNLKEYFLNIDLLRGRDLAIVDHFEINNLKRTVRFYVKEDEFKKSYLIIGVDISHEVLRSEAHEEAKAQQEESARFTIIGQMAAGVAHEISNPLAIISGFLSIMKRSIERENAPFDRDSFLDKISKSLKSIDRIATIIRGLKLFIKNDLNSPYQQVSVQEIVDGALDLCADKFKASGIELIIDQVKPEMMINCRPFQIVQVMVNLLMNSYDALEKLENKWVKISFKIENQNFIISVADSGPGIPQEIQNKIMLPFFSTKNINQGVGLGLSNSKMILQNHMGDLFYDDKNPNTTFKISLRI